MSLHNYTKNTRFKKSVSGAQNRQGKSKTRTLGQNRQRIFETPSGVERLLRVYITKKSASVVGNPYCLGLHNADTERKAIRSTSSLLDIPSPSSYPSPEVVSLSYPSPRCSPLSYFSPIPLLKTVDNSPSPVYNTV